ncbi:phosphorylase [Maridesulfovibrio sp. FT414]|uniref:phosphorylase family protein n=1 Tax=Maridesulfovibrio sp. FT414 TaxID=2979469 RepID=UPI003D804B86
MISGRIAVVAAMEQEARALFPNAETGMNGRYKTLTGKLSSTFDYKCIIAGIGHERAAEAAEKLCLEKPALLMSIGVSGGLAPGLNAGSLIMASAIVSDQDEYKTWRESDFDAAARMELFPACGEIQCGKLVTAESPVLTPQDKLAMHERTGALAVDMESAAVASVAMHHQTPFACIRAISDDYSRGIPPESLGGVNEQGKTEIAPILKAICRRPSLIFQLIPMGMDYSKALKALGTIFMN